MTSSGTLYLDRRRRLPKTSRGDDQEQAFPELEYLTSPEKVTLNRKCEAVEKMRSLVVDHTGTSAPAPSATAYELRSVAVPYGNCIEPSTSRPGDRPVRSGFNVQAAGSTDPIPPT